MSSRCCDRCDRCNCSSAGTPNCHAAAPHTLRLPCSCCLAAEGAKQAAKIGAAVVGAGIGAFVTKQLAAKRQSVAIIELSNVLVRFSPNFRSGMIEGIMWWQPLPTCQMLAQHMLAGCAIISLALADQHKQAPCRAPLRPACAGVAGQPHAADSRHGGGG